MNQLTEEVKTLTKELVDAGAIELSDKDLDSVNGGGGYDKMIKEQSDKILAWWRSTHPKKDQQEQK